MAKDHEVRAARLSVAPGALQEALSKMGSIEVAPGVTLKLKSARGRARVDGKGRANQEITFHLSVELSEAAVQAAVTSNRRARVQKQRAGTRVQTWGDEASLQGA